MDGELSCCASSPLDEMTHLCSFSPLLLRLPHKPQITNCEYSSFDKQFFFGIHPHTFFSIGCLPLLFSFPHLLALDNAERIKICFAVTVGSVTDDQAQQVGVFDTVGEFLGGICSRECNGSMEISILSRAIRHRLKD